MPNKEHPTLGLNGPGPGDAACFPPEGAPWLVLVAWWVVKRPRVPTSRLGTRMHAGLCRSEYGHITTPYFSKFLDRDEFEEQIKDRRLEFAQKMEDHCLEFEQQMDN